MNFLWMSVPPEYKEKYKKYIISNMWMFGCNVVGNTLVWCNSVATERRTVGQIDGKGIICKLCPVSVAVGAVCDSVHCIADILFGDDECTAAWAMSLQHRLCVMPFYISF